MKTIKHFIHPYTQTCSVEESIESVLHKMNEEGANTFTVVNADQVVIGSITLESIQRKVNSGWNLDGKVKDFMFGHPLTVNAYDDEATAFALMKEHGMNQVPVVDDEYHLKGGISFVTIARRMITFKNNIRGYYTDADKGVA